LTSSADGLVPPTAPRVTVAVSTWNRAHLVGRAIASVLAQTFRDFELLVVDDGSTDPTAEVVRGFTDPRLRYLRHPENRGISRARNTAIAAARGEWMAFLDDDNEWSPEYLARQLAAAARRPGSDVLYCRARWHDHRAGIEGIRIRMVPDGRVLRHVVRGWHLLISCTLIRRSVLVELGGLDERLGASEDVDLWLRLARRAEFAGTPEVLVRRHDQHGGRQLSLDVGLHERDLAVLDAKWRAPITADLGRAAYARWWSCLVLWRAVRAVQVGRRGAALRLVGRMARVLPWSAPYVAAALVTVALGPRAHARMVAAAYAWRRAGE